ncbi:MAG: redoxin domain-containing protein [Oscillatoriales cyanobacterium SM2_1_8]|nr:redoxin domain-containing protein [Oscillatoriales cyanobacterium SM2_1_8]
MKTAVRTGVVLREPAPLFALPSTGPKDFILRDRAGKPLVLVFYGGDRLPACREVGRQIQAHLAELEALGAEIVSISPDPLPVREQMAAEEGWTFRLVSDPELQVSGLYGVCSQQLGADGVPQVVYQRAAVLLDRNLRVVQAYTLDGNAPLSPILQDIREWFPPQPAVDVPMQAPVLLIPNVFSQEFCRQLMEAWETRGHGDSGFMKRDGDKTVGYIDHSFKIRQDHFVKDKDLKQGIDRPIQRIVFPEIEKAFSYKATRREDYKIACYDATSGGFFRAHRDNTTGGTAHRRFAMSVNLNTEEYEGGYLRFPEYGPYRYRPETGAAVIFNCSLLHEATEILAGRRFVLLAFFYGEEEAQARRAYEQQAQNDYSQMVILNNMHAQA